MRMTQLAVAAALVLSAGFSQAAVVKTFENQSDTKVGANTFTNFGSPFTIAKQGKYTFDVAITPGANSGIATLADVLFSFQKGVLGFNVVPQYINGAYKNSFTFDAAAGEQVAYALGFTAIGNSKVNIALNTAPVPEPETYALMGMGLVGLLAARRRKMKQAA